MFIFIDYMFGKEIKAEIIKHEFIMYSKLTGIVKWLYYNTWYKPYRKEENQLLLHDICSLDSIADKSRIITMINQQTKDFKPLHCVYICLDI